MAGRLAVRGQGNPERGTRSRRGGWGLILLAAAATLGEIVGFGEPVFIPGYGLNKGEALLLAIAATLLGFGALVLPGSPRRWRTLLLLVSSGMLVGDTAGWIRRSAQPSKYGESYRQGTQKSPFVPVSRVAGCYEMTVPEWSAAEAGANDLLSTRFQLTLDPDPVTRGRFVAVNRDSKVHNGLLFRSWKANFDGTVDLIWSTGYVGYNIRFTDSAKELYGTAQRFTDTDPYPFAARTDNALEVVARRVPCSELTN